MQSKMHGMVLDQKTFIESRELEEQVPREAPQQPWWSRAISPARVLLALGMAAAAVWGLLATSVYVPLYKNIDPRFQLHFLAGHPLTYLGLVARSFLSGRQSLDTLRNMIGYVGWDTPMPWWSIPIFLIPVAAAFLLHDARPDRRRQIVAIGVALAMGFAVITVIFLNDTAVGAPVIDGVQGRYLLPLLGLLVPAGAGLARIGPEFRQRLIVLMPVFLGLSSIVLLERIAVRLY